MAELIVVRDGVEEQHVVPVDVGDTPPKTKHHPPITAAILLAEDGAGNRTMASPDGKTVVVSGYDLNKVWTRYLKAAKQAMAKAEREAQAERRKTAQAEARRVAAAARAVRPSRR